MRAVPQCLVCLWCLQKHGQNPRHFTNEPGDLCPAHAPPSALTSRGSPGTPPRLPVCLTLHESPGRERPAGEVLAERSPCASPPAAPGCRPRALDHLLSRGGTARERELCSLCSAQARSPVPQTAAACSWNFSPCVKAQQAPRPRAGPWPLTVADLPSSRSCSLPEPGEGR